ncbi:MAG: restriction endonuclease [Campylobacterales bacterium]
MTDPAKYFKQYRDALGFTNQQSAKEFFTGKDIAPNIDYSYIESLNQRIVDMLKKINCVVYNKLSVKELDTFIEKNIINPYYIIRDSDLIPRLNNQGRRPEQVLFSWLRGYATLQYFTPAIFVIFNIDNANIVQIGDDNLEKIDTFKRTPIADLRIKLDNEYINIEVQSGFQGINDIKEHKVREAKRVYETENIKTICMHMDLYNGQVAFVRLDGISDDDVNFITRQQMEGQSVFTIDQNYFKWRIMDKLPRLADLELHI